MEFSAFASLVVIICLTFPMAILGQSETPAPSQSTAIVGKCAWEAEFTDPIYGVANVAPL